MTKEQERAAYKQAWAEKNRDKTRAAAKRWREAHPEVSKARISKWQKANKDKVNATTKKWADKNKPARKKYARKYRKENNIALNETKRLWVSKNKDKAKSYDLKKNYGINLAEFNAMLFAQDYRCKIRKIHQDNIAHTLNVDHCHTTGKVRGLLCNPCNKAIGFLRDNPNNCFAAGEYLKSFEEQS